MRILLDESKTAVGIEVRPNPIFHSGDADQPTRNVKAKKLVMASCGACSTPSLLERFSIGETQVLGRAGVPVAVDLPGVGQGYEDTFSATPTRIPPGLKILSMALCS